MADTVTISKGMDKEEISSLFSKLDKKISVTDEAVEIIHEAINTPEFDGFKFTETMVTYQNVLEGTSGSLVDYLNAVKFCSFLEANDGNYTDAYIKTFWKRDFIQSRKNAPTNSVEYKQITSAATRYRKSKMVVSILTQSQVPFYILFQGYREKAMKRLVYEMDNAALPKDRINAAKEVLAASTPPEELQVKVDFNEDKENIVDRYEKAMQKMVEAQRNMINAGAKIEDITNVEIVETEVLE